LESMADEKEKKRRLTQREGSFKAGKYGGKKERYVLRRKKKKGETLLLRGKKKEEGRKEESLKTSGGEKVSSIRVGGGGKGKKKRFSKRWKRGESGIYHPSLAKKCSGEKKGRGATRGEGVFWGRVKDGGGRKRFQKGKVIACYKALTGQGERGKRGRWTYALERGKKTELRLISQGAKKGERRGKGLMTLGGVEPCADWGGKIRERREGSLQEGIRLYRGKKGERGKKTMLKRILMLEGTEKRNPHNGLEEKRSSVGG